MGGSVDGGSRHSTYNSMQYSPFSINNIKNITHRQHREPTQITDECAPDFGNFLLVVGLHIYYCGLIDIGPVFHGLQSKVRYLKYPNLHNTKDYIIVKYVNRFY
jgi:hypothetical protein